MGMSEARVCYLGKHWQLATCAVLEQRGRRRESDQTLFLKFNMNHVRRLVIYRIFMWSRIIWHVEDTSSRVTSKGIHSSGSFTVWLYISVCLCLRVSLLRVCVTFLMHILHTHVHCHCTGGSNEVLENSSSGSVFSSSSDDALATRGGDRR